MRLSRVPVHVRRAGYAPRVAAAAFAAVVLAGCAGAGMDRQFQRSAMPTRIGDAQPASGVAHATRMPVQGIDVSSHNGDIDWAAVRRAGISFAYLKTTEGGDYADRRFFEHWRAAEDAGVHRGAYHFMYWCRPADQQALFFMVNIPNDPDALPPVLDLEWNHDSPSCPVKLPRSKAVPMIRTLLEAMEARTGKRPVIYTDSSFYRDILAGGDFDRYPLWLRSTASPPEKLYPGVRYTFWQFTGTGRVPGIRGDVDRNVFNGSAEDWVKWLGAAGIVPVPASATASAAAKKTA